MTDTISADDKMMLEGLYWWDIPTLFRAPNSFAVWSNSPARCFDFTRFKFQMDTGDVLAEAQRTRRKGLGCSVSDFIATASPGSNSRWVQGRFWQRRRGVKDRDGFIWFLNLLLRLCQNHIPGKISKRHTLQRITHKAEMGPPPRLSSASSAPLREHPLSLLGI